MVHELGRMILSTLGDVAPIALFIVFFQGVVLRQPIPKLSRMLLGGVLVVLGLSVFLIGLEKALFPLGDLMATQLADPAFVGAEPDAPVEWTAYYWIYLFAATIGFATAIAEPALIAVALKASETSAGTISPIGLRLSVAAGIGSSLMLGTFRIVTGLPLQPFILGGIVLVAVQSYFAPRTIVSLAYDSGVVATSIVTVPIVVALGLGLSNAIPGRDPAIDGFGMIAMGCLFPILAVMTYAQVVQRLDRRNPSSKEP